MIQIIEELEARDVDSITETWKQILKPKGTKVKKSASKTSDYKFPRLHHFMHEISQEKLKDKMDQVVDIDSQNLREDDFGQDSSGDERE